MVDRETLALARQLRELQISTQGQARTAQISRSSLPLVEYGVDEAGEPIATDTEVMVGELLAQVPDLSETVDGHDEQIGVIDETNSENVITVVDVMEWGSQQAEETHQVQLQVIEAWEHAADMQTAHEILVETAAELDTKLGEARTDIEEAEGRLEGAETRLTNAETRLTNAETKKNRIRSGLTDPPADNPGGAIGDKYEKRNADGALLAAWSWEGDPAAWVPVPMAESYIPLLNIGDGTYGELSGDRLQAKSVTADQVDAQALAVLAAEIKEAWIRSAHILDLDVGKLIVTDGAEIDEAVIEKLWADVVKARLLVATEGIIAGSAIIDGTLLAKHMSAEFFEGQHLKGVLVEGGRFVGATYELQAAGTWSTIYNPGAVTTGTIADFHGGAPSAVAPAALTAGSARVSAPAGQIVGYWTNNDAVTPVGQAQRRVSIRVRSSVALSGVHLMVGDKLLNGPDLVAGAWTTMTVELATGDRLEWIHVAGTAAAAVTLDIDTVKVESSALAGATLAVSLVDGVPGMRVRTPSGATILDLSPLGLISSSVDGSEQAKLQYGKLDFIGASTHTIASPSGLQLDGPVIFGSLPEPQSVKVSGAASLTASPGVWQDVPGLATITIVNPTQKKLLCRVDFGATGNASAGYARIGVACSGATTIAADQPSSGSDPTGGGPHAPFAAGSSTNITGFKIVTLEPGSTVFRLRSMRDQTGTHSTNYPGMLVQPLSYKEA